MSWCSGCRDGAGCGEEERPTGGRTRGSMRLRGKQETVEEEMSNEVKKRTKSGRMRCIRGEVSEKHKER